MIAWIQSHHLHLQWKFKFLAGKFTWHNKAKHCWVMSTNFLLSRVCWQCPAMFCKLSHPWFEFSQKVKVMGLNPGYLLKSTLYCLKVKIHTKNYFCNKMSNSIPIYSRCGYHHYREFVHPKLCQNRWRQNGMNFN